MQGKDLERPTNGSSNNTKELTTEYNNVKEKMDPSPENIVPPAKRSDSTPPPSDKNSDHISKQSDSSSDCIPPQSDCSSDLIPPQSDSSSESIPPHSYSIPLRSDSSDNIPPHSDSGDGIPSPSAVTEGSTVFLSITFERLAVSSSAELEGSKSRQRRISVAAAAAAPVTASSRSESTVLGRSGRQPPRAAGVLRRSKLAAANKLHADSTVTAVTGDRVRDTSCVTKAAAAMTTTIFGGDFSAAFDNFATLSLGEGASSGGEEEGGRSAHQFAGASYRSSSVCGLHSGTYVVPVPTKYFFPDSPLIFSRFL